VTSLYIAHVAVGKQLSAEDSREAEKFILLLLDEAKKSQLFDPKKEFSKAEGLQSYSLFNVYLANYVSAQFMLATAVAQEATLRNEFKRYDASRLDLAQEESEHIDKFMLACGMYFSSAITYFYMAIEGFINIILDSYIQKKYRDGAMNIKKRFDIDLKLRCLPVLCDGFAQEYVGPTSDIFSKFRKLTEYRNTIFHSNLEESLRSLTFIEDGFRYQCHLSKVNKQFLPSLKIMLTANDVLEVQRLVDEIVEMVLNSMTEEAKFLATTYIRNSPIIPFYIGADGSHSMGESKRKKLNETEGQGV
jgi:hypothetical protein